VSFLWPCPPSQAQPANTPALQVVHDIDPAPVKRSYPISATSAMLPLDPSEPPSWHTQGTPLAQQSTAPAQHCTVQFSTVQCSTVWSMAVHISMVCVLVGCVGGSREGVQSGDHDLRGTSTKAVPVNGGSRVASEANMIYQVGQASATLHTKKKKKKKSLGCPNHDLLHCSLFTDASPVPWRPCCAPSQAD